MAKVSASVFLLMLYCVLVNFVSAKTVPPSTVEPFPDLYAMTSTYPTGNNVVNYNASPNPQYSSNNFNNFNQPSPPPSSQMLGNFQNTEYQAKPINQQMSSDESETGSNPTKTTTYDYSNDLKNTLSTMKDNLGFMADTQRLLLNSFKVQQQQYNDIEEKLQERKSGLERTADYNYGPPATPQPQYQSIPSLPPLPYGQPTKQVETFQHKQQTHKKEAGRLFKKHKKPNGRGLALFRRRTEAARMERHAAMTLTYLRNGIMNALWTAVIVACVKLAPILLFGFKLMFRSVLPLTGIALFGANRGIFPQHMKLDDDDDDDDDDDGDVRFDDEDDEDDSDGED